MGREIQKKKNRSGLQKIRQKPKSKKLNLVKNRIIAANWDKSQTLAQNYKRLGLTSKLNKNTGGVEKKAADLEEAASRAETGESGKDDVLSIVASKRPDKLQVTEARIERDPETGRILRVIEAGKPRANPLHDPLNDLDSEDENGMASFGQHPTRAIPSNTSGKPHSEVVKELEHEANKPANKYNPRQSEIEREFIRELVEKHGDDYGKMARDLKINYMQRSEGDLKRRVKKWRESGGKIS